MLYRVWCLFWMKEKKTTMQSSNGNKQIPKPKKNKADRLHEHYWAGFTEIMCKTIRKAS